MKHSVDCENLYESVLILKKLSKQAAERNIILSVYILLLLQCVTGFLYFT